MILPFGFAEGWARAVWGDPASVYAPLDFRPMKEADYVHLVIGGLTKMGCALLVEAIRVAHYRSGSQTRITIADEDRSRFDAFCAAYPGLVLLSDMRIEYASGNLYATTVRSMLVESARDSHCLLTIAACDDNPDETLAAALSLPHDVYVRPPVSGESRMETAPRILVYQEHADKVSRTSPDRLPVSDGSRLQNVQVFGYQEKGIPTWCFQRHAAMEVSWVYKNQNWEETYGGRAVDDIPWDDLKKSAYDGFVDQSPSLIWANAYVADSYGTVFRSAGFRCRMTSDWNDFKSSLYRGTFSPASH